MNQCNQSFYVPRVQELENANDDNVTVQTDETVGNQHFDEDTSCYYNNCNNNGYHFNGTQHHANCIGTYTISVPLIIFHLRTITLYPAKIIKGDLDVTINNEANINYHKLFFDTTSGIRAMTLSCDQNNRTFQVGVQDGKIKLYLKGSIQVESDKNTDLSIDNPIIHTHVFDNCVELMPFENLDDCDPTTYQVYCPNLDNTGSLLFNYTYVNRQFTIAFIILTTAFSIPKPFI